MRNAQCLLYASYKVLVTPLPVNKFRIHLGNHSLTAYVDDAIDYWLACSTNDREVGVRVPLAADRVATVVQLLSAP